MQLEIILTKKEIRTRKVWLLITLIGFGFTLCITGFGAIQGYNHQPVNLIGSFFSVLFNAIYITVLYQLCYKRHTTFLITLQQVSTAGFLLIMIFTDILMFFNSLTTGLGGLIGTSIIFLPLLYIFRLNMRMRRINKVLKCLQSLPGESNELIQAFQNIADVNDLESLSEKYKSKSPKLRYLAMRQKNLRKQELQSA